MTLGLLSKRAAQRGCMAVLRLSTVPGGAGKVVASGLGEGSDGGTSTEEALTSRQGWWSDVVGDLADGRESGGASTLQGAGSRGGPMAWQGHRRSSRCRL